MKANEFVGFHGIGTVKDIVKHYGNHTHVTDDARMFITEDFYKKTKADYVDDLNSMIKMTDLKRLVESHELVEWHGGLKHAKNYFERNSKQYPDAVGGWDSLKQAIADVESCLKVDKKLEGL